ncbi:GIY-YIG nuclease family protein [Xanthomarina sp.]|uniref:GIY-YIG nuclease family protein n=1 Tax=Xanthomarina sp. TaxID=1931211 RepID=UPI002B80C950|nr:GIY-YIG nuclease family protein [Xanthomarina sp.]HLV38078.1 GIY-YIG nuclease family protein [Xanthomarina sp.]
MKLYYTYVLKSNVDGRLYKGHTDDVEKRLREHNAGKTKSTKGFIPWELVYFEIFKSKLEAVLREKYFKTGSGREFLKDKINS